MNITQICIGRFHHFQLARQLESQGLLNKIYTGYPRFKLKNEQGIPSSKIVTFPWFQVPYLFRSKIGLGNSRWLKWELAWLAKESLDRYVESRLRDESHVVGLSSSGLHTGISIKKRGGFYICDRGSSHIEYQNEILTEEYTRFGFKFEGIDPRIIKKELREYEVADYISVPSEFVKQSFILKGVPENKIIKIPYGANLNRFQKDGDPDSSTFRVLWVGAISLRKGFMYALDAFQRLKHPKKEFLVIGAMSPEVRQLLVDQNLKNVIFKGQVNNTGLSALYSSSQVLVLSSVEEGLAMVQGEALACGCPVIATENTGASDLFSDAKEGFIIPIRDSDAILNKMQLICDNPHLREEMSHQALTKVREIGGWDTYGQNYGSFLKNIK